MLVTKILFWIFVSTWAFSVYLLFRFIQKVQRSKLLRDSDIEALGLLILSGDGRTQDERRALRYVLSRKYANLPDLEAVKLGDAARTGWFVASALMICTGVSLMLFGW